MSRFEPDDQQGRRINSVPPPAPSEKRGRPYRTHRPLVTCVLWSQKGLSRCWKNAGISPCERSGRRHIAQSLQLSSGWNLPPGQGVSRM